MAFSLALFNSYVYSSYTETAQQNTDLFNRASRGALVLSPRPFQGDYEFEAIFKNINGIVRRRDSKNGDNAVTPVTLNQIENASVKIDAGTPPIKIPPADYRRILLDPALGGVMIGEQLAKAIVVDQINTIIRALAGAVTNQSKLTHDISSGSGDAAKANFRALNATAVKFGDQAGELVAWVMHSIVMHDLYDNALANGERLFSFRNVNVQRDQAGRLLIMTDSPALSVTTGTGETEVTKYTTLGLTQGAGVITTNNDMDVNIELSNGTENIQRTYQGEWTYNATLKGYSWDTTNGGDSPSDTAIGTGTNWDMTSSDVKTTAGVALISK